MWYTIVVTVLVGYMLGNLNGAICVSAMMNDDVRTHGSGNAGLTNFIRNYGVGKALYVILIDAGKAVLACVAGGLMLMPYFSGAYAPGAIIGGLAVILGHDFPALLGFKGGKGSLSGLFVAFSVDYRIALIVLAVFILIYALTKYVSLGSIIAALTYSGCFIGFYLKEPVVAICGGVAGLMVVFMHRSNFVRLIKGQERKTNLFKK